MKILKSEISQVRLDKYLAEKLVMSRESVAKMIESEQIKVNDKKVKNSYLIQLGDEIKITKPSIKPFEYIAKDIPLDIIYEDEYLIVINKQSGLTVHPGSGNKENTLVNALLYYNKNLSDIGGLDRPGVVHRIDKDTSGLMIFAKNNQIHNLLATAFKNKQIKREYLALVKGILPSKTGTIDAPIGRDNKNRLKMTVKAENSKKAITHFKVLKTFKEYTLLKLFLDTGRTHQIRVHLAYIGYPIYNDPVYGKDKSTEFGQFLHSSSLDFIHPVTQEKKHFECSLPEEFQNFIDNLEA